MECSTRFAPAERSSRQEISSSHRLLLKNQSLALLDAIPVIVVILDRNRQIVYGNAPFLALLEGGNLDLALGKRPGEFLDCVHANALPGGCGTTEFCSQCGAVRAILNSLDGRRDVQECQIRRYKDGREEALDLRVSSVPYSFSGESFTIFSINDISHEKRRQALEGVFFHDVLNTLGGLKNMVEFVIDEGQGPYRDEFTLIRDVSERLIEELAAQKQLLAAENGELAPSFQIMNAKDALRHLQRMYQNHELCKDVRLALDPGAMDILLVSDPKLVERVVGNMVKNALEASKPGQTATLGCAARDGQVVFWAHNESDIPHNVSLRIFNRSFSTKEHGRGQGTYGMKLLGERYLGGKVWFETGQGNGTTFYLSLPAGSPESGG